MYQPYLRIALVAGFIAMTACTQTQVKDNSLAAAKGVASAVGDVAMQTALTAAVGPTPLTPEQTAEDHENCRTLERCDTALQAHIRRRKAAESYLDALEKAEDRKQAIALKADFAARGEAPINLPTGDSIVILDSGDSAPSLYQEAALDHVARQTTDTPAVTD
ncbi:MAG: hypothetical protein AB8F65_08790 [Woeseiaceae bacterium]